MFYFMIFPTVRCNPLDTLVSGTSELSSADGASIVDFSCKIGASLAGESTLRCHSDGTWTTDIPTCGMFVVIDIKAI